MPTRAIATATTAISLAFCGGAAAQTAQVTQSIFDENGLPSLVANSTPDGSKGTIAWTTCPPGGPCTASGTGNTLDPGDVPAGTTFTATVTYGDQVTSDTSPAWQGRVAPTAPPTLTGRARAGAVVMPHAGTWTGGWPGDYDALGVEACRTPQATDCETVKDATGHALQPAGPIVVGPAYAGWYLFAMNIRYPRDEAFAAFAYTDPTAAPPLTTGPTIARSAPLGPVAANKRLGAKILPRARRVRGRIIFAKVRCPRRCRVTLTGGYDAPAQTIDRKGLVGVDANLRPGRYDLIVRIDGGLAAVGHSRLRR